MRFFTALLSQNTDWHVLEPHLYSNPLTEVSLPQTRHFRFFNHIFFPIDKSLLNEFVEYYMLERRNNKLCLTYNFLFIFNILKEILSHYTAIGAFILPKGL